MEHSKQCKEVLSRCDFPEDCYIWIEKLCLKYTSKQIISLVWSKDKKGIHDWDWFEPFFNKGYVPIIKDIIEININKEFWEAYNIICEFVDPFDISNMGLISEMSEDTCKIEQAIKKSKPSIGYLYKVWQDTEVEYIPVNNSQMVDISKHNVVVRGIF